VTRRQALLVLAGGIGRPGPEALVRAARYLWGRQAADGGWPSDTYGLLRSGQSLTAFVLDSLLLIPQQAFRPSASQVGRAFTFLDRHTDPEGAVGRRNPLIPDYPNYATALAVMAQCRAGRRDQSTPLVEYLRRQQFSEQSGWSRDHPAYGAWGIGGDRRTPPEPGHVDLSMTRHVLQALAAGGAKPGDAALALADVFLERCQNRDGGFLFSTVVAGANKAGPASYGTATADGILSLVAIGARQNDQRLQVARRWLAARHRPGIVPGLTGEAHRRWAQGLRFYYAAARAEAMPELPPDSALAGEQRPDGSWVNPEPLVKEDDPLIATGLAVRALVEWSLPDTPEGQVNHTHVPVRRRSLHGEKQGTPCGW